VIDNWLKTPQDQQIPLMEHVFDYAIHAILAAVYECDDHRLVSSVHDSYKVVSFFAHIAFSSCLFFIIFVLV